MKSQNMLHVPEFSSEAECEQWLKDNPYYCAKPFYSRELTQTNESIWCCHWGSPFETLTDLNKYDKTVFKKDQPISDCSYCYKIEESGTTSERFTDSLYTLVHQRDWVDNTDVKSLKLRLDNICNVSCQMCNADNSSLYDKVTGSNVGIIGLNDEIWKTTLEDLKSADILSLLGGETFLSPKTEIILNAEHSLKQVQFQTNCTVYKKNILEAINRVPSVDFGLSIDGIGVVNEYTRWPSKWSKIKRNVERFFQYDFNFIATPVVNIYTALYLDELVDFYYPYMKDGVDIIITPFLCIDPEWMDMSILPANALTAIEERSTKLLDHPVITEFPLQTTGLVESLNSIINVCQDASPNPGAWDEFLVNNAMWDKIQDTSFKDSLPELHSLIYT